MRLDGFESPSRVRVWDVLAWRVIREGRAVKRLLPLEHARCVRSFVAWRRRRWSVRGGRVRARRTRASRVCCRRRRGSRRGREPCGKPFAWGAGGRRDGGVEHVPGRELEEGGELVAESALDVVQAVVVIRGDRFQGFSGGVDGDGGGGRGRRRAHAREGRRLHPRRRGRQIFELRHPRNRVAPERRAARTLRRGFLGRRRIGARLERHLERRTARRRHRRGGSTAARRVQIVHAVRDESAFLTRSASAALARWTTTRGGRETRHHTVKLVVQPSELVTAFARKKRRKRRHRPRRIVALDVIALAQASPHFPTSPLRPVCTRLLVDNPVFAKSRPRTGGELRRVRHVRAQRRREQLLGFVEPSAADGGSSSTWTRAPAAASARVFARDADFPRRPCRMERWRSDCEGSFESATCARASRVVDDDFGSPLGALRLRRRASLGDEIIADTVSW